VLTSLPRSRPVRRSSKRGERPARESVAGATEQNAAATVAPKRKPAARPRPKAQATGKPRATNRPAETAQKHAPQAGAPPRAAPARKVPPAGYASPALRTQRERSHGPPELITTVLQAANELAQIGLEVGRQTLQSMLDRLPKP